MTENTNPSGITKKRLWIIPVIIVLIIALSGGAYYAFSRYQIYQAELQAQIQAELQAERQRIQESEAKVQAELQVMSAAINRETFYEGIYINDLSVGGMTRDAAAKMLEEYEKKIRDSFQVQLSMSDKKLTINANMAGMTFDSAAILAKAYETGRKPTAIEEKAKIAERFATVEALKKTPLRLVVKTTIEFEKVRQQIMDWAGGMSYAAVEAQVAGFDMIARTFQISASANGLNVDAKATADAVVEQLAAGKYSVQGTLKGEILVPKISSDALRDKMGLVSTATTLAGASSSVNRDYNITLITSRINGHMLKPGDIFSYNKYFGQRTAEKGYREAGGIKDGILIQELGGGICQPNTTLFQAVMKADLAVVDRSPHSWPSAYTSVGLDATVSWPGPDFRFQNNTEYPVVIIASFKKPNVVFQIYGRLLDPGISITLLSEHNGYIPEAAPIMKLNPLLAPGAKVEIRKPHTGQRATAYKIWKKDGVVIKRELAFTSYYRPIQGLYEIGPAVVPPVPTVTPPVPTAVLTPAPTTAP
jgi:vancomycin resistance protein YoaR